MGAPVLKVQNGTKYQELNGLHRVAYSYKLDFCNQWLVSKDTGAMEVTIIIIKNK